MRSTQEVADMLTTVRNDSLTGCELAGIWLGEELFRKEAPEQFEAFLRGLFRGMVRRRGRGVTLDLAIRYANRYKKEGP